MLASRFARTGVFTGVFHETEILPAGPRARALVARSFMVRLRPLGTPLYCHSYFDQRLSIRRTTPHGPAWFAPGTTFRIPPAHR